MESMKRSMTCGALSSSNVGQKVILNGWVHRKREHGEISFFNLRDRYGITQIVVDSDASPMVKEVVQSLKMEYCVAVSGVVRLRPDEMINPDMLTGEIEVRADEIVVLSTSDVLPFQIDDKTKAGEDLRLTYRYLDLRSFSMQKNIIMRSHFTFAVREYLTHQGFLEIETPTFIKSTPEGARDYLVPSRLYHGKFYALPQSPQLYKQLLMVSGFDKYFQIARCYRDEDARGDRQPEFTQIDIEMSFVSREDVLALTEGLLNYVFEKCIGTLLPSHFERLTYDEAISFYGTDKPDLRFELCLKDASFLSEVGECEFFKKAIEDGKAIRALVVPAVAKDYSRKKIEELESVAKIYKANALYWTKVGSSGLEGGIAKFFKDADAVCKPLGANEGDLLLFISDEYKKASIALGAVRSKLGKDLSLIKTGEFKFLWIVDFPLFEWNEDDGRWEAAHHMFSSPQEKYLDTLESDPGSVKGDLYDLVLNGYEVASGSIRIHDAALQKRIFKIVGFDEDDAEKKFGFLTKAFRYGPPPHGGIAPGLDRILMIMAEETSIKEVIAFPKNSFALSPMDEAPSFVDEEQLKELGLSITE